MSGLGWRQEDDEDVEPGFTWKRSCQQCGGAMPIAEKGDFCSDWCEEQYDEDIDGTDDDEDDS